MVFTAHLFLVLVYVGTVGSDEDLDPNFKNLPDFRLKLVNTGPGQLIYFFNISVD